MKSLSIMVLDKILVFVEKVEEVWMMRVYSVE